MKKQVDLTTLSGWANLSAGNHTIKIKAKGTGYKDSELSAGVTVSKAASTVTLSAGTYKFVDSPQFYTVESDESISVDLSGKMNTLVAENTYGEMSPFTSITIYFSPVSSRNYVTISNVDENDNTNYINYQSSEWSYINKNGEEFTATDTSKLRTIILETDQQVSPEFYNWAITQGNLVKQAAEKKVTLSLDGDPGYMPDSIDLYQCDDDKGTNKELLITITSSADNNKVITVTKAYLYHLGAYGGYTKVDGDMEYHILWDSCLTGDTLITMADKSEKRIDKIEVGDKVLSVDFDTKQHIVSEVVYTDKEQNKQHSEYDLWKFSDGTEIKTVRRHEFYNLEAKRMKYMDEWKIGEHTLKVDGTHPALVEHKTVKEVVKHYKLTLDGNTAYFANGLLSGDRHCPKDKAL